MKRKKISVLCIYAIGIYAGVQYIGETEARFTTTNSQQVELTTALVFPSTIQKQKQEAEKIRGQILHIDHSVSAIKIGNHLDQLARHLKKLDDFEQQLSSLTVNLSSISKQLESYTTLTSNDSSYSYVIEGERSVKAIQNELIHLKLQAKISNTRLAIENAISTVQGKESTTNKKENDSNGRDE